MLIYAHLWSDEMNNSDELCYLLLGVPEFIKQALQAVTKFESVVSQIQNNERDIYSKLQLMVTTNLLKCPVPDKSNNLPGKKNLNIIF